MPYSKSPVSAHLTFLRVLSSIERASGQTTARKLEQLHKQVVDGFCKAGLQVIEHGKVDVTLKAIRYEAHVRCFFVQQAELLCLVDRVDTKAKAKAKVKKIKENMLLHLDAVHQLDGGRVLPSDDLTRVRMEKAMAQAITRQAQEL